MQSNKVKANSSPYRANFDVDTKTVVITSTSESTTTANDIIIEAGEDLTSYTENLISIGTDGLAYKSTAKYSDEKYGQYFLINAPDIGEYAILRRYGQIDISTTLTVNLPIYLTTGTPNFTQTIPTKTAEIDLLQYVGYASDVNTIVIDIKLAKQYD